jgi:hypothetical protein
VASNRRVSVGDEEAVYRRLREISDLLDRIPTSGEISEFGGPQDISITAIRDFALDLHRRASTLERSIVLLQSNTADVIRQMRTTIKDILEVEAEAEEQAKKLAAETEKLGSGPTTKTWI